MKIYLTLFLIYFTTSLFSQTLTCDKIICINGEEIDAVISEITPEFISYKKCDNVDGPKYSVDKTKVFLIKYKNGTKEVINDLNKPIATTELPKKIKKPHNKFYKGLEIHFDAMANPINPNGQIINGNYFRQSSFNLSGLFLCNYKVNKFIEFDALLGVGGREIDYSKYYREDFQSSFSTESNTKLVSGTNENYGIAEFGIRINYLNLIKQQKQQFVNPFLKPEITIVTSNKSPILSYSIILGVNFNKFISVSIGYKYTPMKTITDNSYTTYNYTTTTTNNTTTYHTTSNTSHSYSNSTIGFHNVLGKISFEF